MRSLWFGCLCLFFSVQSQAGEIYTEFPDRIGPAGKYVFYSHGLIVEGENPKPVHPKFGVYDFPAIKRALASGDFDLIAFHRPANTNPVEYATQLSAQVDSLIVAGVKPANITLLGFSIGGLITALASNELRNEGLNVIIMAGCSPWLNKQSGVKIYGRFLSVYETSDTAGSCKALAERSPDIVSFDEVAIDTGKEHGAFYMPIDDWVTPVMNWIDSAGDRD